MSRRAALAKKAKAALPGLALPTSRMQSRGVQAVLRMPGGYEGASGERREFANWNVLDAGPNTDTLGDLPALRARSLDLERNAPLATGAFNTQLRDVIGDGLQPKPRIDREYLGLSAEEAAAWGRHAMRIWWAHAGTTRLDIAGRLTFAQLQRQALFAHLSGGDCFSFFRHVKRTGDLLGTKLQLVEANRISQPDGKVETDVFRDGLELDANGVVVGVWYTNRHPTERWMPGGGALQWSRADARDAQGWPSVMQLFEQRRPGQLRGIPYLAPVIGTLKNLARYSEAELMAAVVSSMFTVFVKGGYKPGLGELDEENPAPAGQVSLGTGAIVDLAEGEDVTFADPKRPNAAFDPFFLAMCRQLGSALEIPYEQLVNSFQASYSASRAALLNAWRAVRTRRSWFVDQFTQPVYAQVIREAVASGLLQAPGFWDDPLAQAAWLGCEWSGPAMPEIDPVKAVTAAKMRVEEEFSTRDKESAELTGTDWAENHAQRVTEESSRRRDGLDTESTAERVRVEPVLPEAPATGAPAAPTAPVDGSGDGSGDGNDSDVETANGA